MDASQLNNYGTLIIKTNFNNNINSWSVSRKKKANLVSQDPENCYICKIGRQNRIKFDFVHCPYFYTPGAFIEWVKLLRR